MSVHVKVPRPQARSESSSPNPASAPPVTAGDKADARAEVERADRFGHHLDKLEVSDRGGLPGHLRAGLEKLSGVDLSGVRVHYGSPKPAQLQALAYAQGNDIHLAPGQEQHLPHEAWHVVQQKRGRVRPTLRLGGVEINDDPGLEKEASDMGSRAAAVKDEAASVAGTPPAATQAQTTLQGMFSNDWEKRRGGPSRRVKKNMELTGGLVEPGVKKNFQDFRARGSKNPRGAATIDAAHRQSDYRVRRMFMTFRQEVDANEQGQGQRSGLEFADDIERYLSSVWDPSQQTPTQNQKVEDAQAALIKAHGEGRKLTYAEAAKIGNAVTCICNESLKNIGPGDSSENRRIGERPDQRFQYTPGRKHLTNTPITKEQRRVTEGLARTYTLPSSPSIDYRSGPRSSSLPSGLPLPPVYSPLPSASTGGKKTKKKRT